MHFEKFSILSLIKFKFFFSQINHFSQNHKFKSHRLQAFTIIVGIEQQVLLTGGKTYNQVIIKYCENGTLCVSQQIVYCYQFGNTCNVISRNTFKPGHAQQGP